METDRRTETSERGGALVRFVLLLALIALAAAWIATTRSGREFRRGAERGAGDFRRGWGQVERRAREVSRGAALAEARARLAARKVELAGREIGRAGAEIEDVRRRLERTYARSTGRARERWAALDADLRRLARQAERGGAGARRALDETLEALRRGERDEKRGERKERGAEGAGR